VHPIGIGTWNIASRINPDNLGSKYRGVEPVKGNEEREIEALRYSLSRGQNHLDCAEMYGGFYTDEVVGRAIADSRRERLFVADKLWTSSYGPGLVRPTVEQMLAKLGTDYLDMLYIHSPWTGVPWQPAVPQIDELIEEGLVRNWAVSNFDVSEMEEAMKLSKHPLAANQVLFNVLDQAAADAEFRAFCREHEIVVVAYRPLERRAVTDNEMLRAIAQKHGVTANQVALAWLIQMDTLPIPKATTKAHIDENLGALKLELYNEDMLALAEAGTVI